MSFTDDEIDELLARYMDQELSSNEMLRLEQILARQPEIRSKLNKWEEIRRGLKTLSSASKTANQLPFSLADSVIQAARLRVAESGDSTLAPWIERAKPISSVESARRLEERDAIPASGVRNSSRLKRNWLFGIAASGIAVCLLAITYFSSAGPASNTLLSKNELPATVPSAIAPINGDSVAQRPLKLELETSNADLVVSKEESQSTSKTPESSLPFPSIASNTRSSQEGLGMKSANLSSQEVATRPSDPIPSTPSTVSPSLAPSIEQLKLLEDMLANPKGSFLFVIDVSLPTDIDNLDSLRNLLDNYDIAWASQLEIDESIQMNLAKSRMIAEAGKNGLLADFAQPKPKIDEPGSESKSKEVVSLVFVKARGKRLDSALIEVMQRTDDFPLFSFDLAFDPPTNQLMNELRFIQEASLPSTSSQETQNRSTAVRLAMPSERNTAANYFAAGPRRTPAMSLETRRQSRLPENSELMNPVSYALFIVRYSMPENR